MKKPNGFYSKLKKPIYTLAPMADVTDAAFRKLISIHGKPDILYTEFISCDGLCSPGKDHLIKILKYDELERPIVAQVFGKNPKTYAKAIKMIAEMGFDGIDINMGCPEKNVCKQGAGASLIKEPELAKELIQITKENSNGLPVTVKTRIGYNKIMIREWIEKLLEAKPEIITVHLRTAKEMSKYDAHWDQIHHAVELAKDTDTLIIGNGDIKSLEQADQLVEETGIDGVMFGRAIFGNPWLFNRNIKRDEVTVNQILDIMIEHAQLYHDTFGENKPFLYMRKHLWAYATDFYGAKELRIAFEKTETVDDVKQAVESFRNKFVNSDRPT